MTKIETTETSLTIERILAAPIERVWAALTDPAAIGRWYHPGPMTTEVEAWEPEPGGELDITMVAPPEMELEEGDPGRYHNLGTFREAEAPKRLVHTWRWADMDIGESLVTYELTEVEGGTKLVLTHTKLPDREQVESHSEGWAGCLENLAAELA